MAESVILRTYELPSISGKEVRRYMSCAESDEINSLIVRTAEKLQPYLVPKVCFSLYDITISDDMVISDSFVFRSANLVTSLKNSDKAVLFSASLGIQLDRIISRFGVSDPAMSLCAHAIGNERVEALCDVFCEDIKRIVAAEGKTVTPRFSPGYGDLDICNQTCFCELLSLQKNLGICLNESYLMTPSKSVTALFGIRKI